MIEYQEEFPIKAKSKLKLQERSINQIISFYYKDVAQTYYHYDEIGLLNSLLETITENMQFFLDSDDIYINREIISLKIIKTFLLYKNGNKDEPVIHFDIINENEFELVKGLNKVLLEAEKELVSYPIFSTWVFPGKIIAVSSTMKFKINGFNVKFWASIGDNIGGKEEFDFYI